ncbi:MAG: sensor histidine kinase N-terminal domain-containing protein [Woeseiaceae bacterium]|nr:sensor histidine kinase N-terminal domain-containing protein [Woeseiaceae bacterium]
MSRSLRASFSLWLGIPLLLAAGVLLFENYHNAHRSANAAHDNSLYASALAIADHVVVEGTALEVDLPYIALEMLSATGDDHVYYKVVGENGTFITGYKDLPEPSEADAQSENGETTFFDSEFRGQTIRVAKLDRSIHRQSRNFEFSVYVAETVGERERLARELTTSFGSRFLLLIILLIAIAWFGTSRALKPLKKFEESLSRRSQHDLRPIDLDVPTEIKVLVEAINSLMDRLQRSFSEIREFVDDASHQLRTPLASLKTQLELATNEPDPEKLRVSLDELLVATSRTGRLAEQLLVHARAGGSQDFEVLELGQLAESVTRNWVARALQAKVDLGLDRSPETLLVRGNQDLLEELLNNLIQNAIQYSPEGSEVTVRTSPAELAAALEVVDNGPGIPEPLREDALRRFRRLGPKEQSGCGLGLAIAKDIAELHGGSLLLSDAPDGAGLVVRLELPRIGAGT